MRTTSQRPCSHVRLPALFHLFDLQRVVQTLRAAGQNLALMLNLHYLHLGFHIFFLFHNSVLHSLLNDYLLTIHDVETLRGLSHTATLKVVIIVNCPLSICVAEMPVTSFSKPKNSGAKLPLYVR